MRDVQVALVQAGARVFRNQTGRYQLADGRWIGSGLCKGSSDLIGWTSTGKFLAVEVKTPTGRTTPEQEAFISAVRKSGGVAFVARSAEEAISLLAKDTDEPGL